MGDNKQKQFSCSVLWFQNWNNEERKSFGRVLLEHEQNTSNTLPSMVAHTSYNNTSNTLPILTNTMNRLMLNSNQGLLSNSTFDTTPNTLSNTMDQLSLNQGQMYPELNEDDLSLFNCLSIEGQGMSLFNCQMKIFVKWYENWTASQRSEFAHQINTIDPELISSISAQFQCHPRSQAQFVLR